MRADPKTFALQKDNVKGFLSHVKMLYEQYAQAGKLVYKNSFYLQRGRYDIVSVMKESVSQQPLTVKGNLIDLYDPQLPILHSKKIRPGEQGFFLDINRIQNKKTGMRNPRLI